MVAAIGDVERAVKGNMNAVRLVQLDLERGAADALAALPASARDANDFAFLRKIPADDVVLRVGDKDAAVEVHAEMFRPVQSGLRGRAPVARVPFSACPDNGPDCPVRLDHAEGIATAFQDVDASAAIGDHRAWNAVAMPSA